MNMREKCAGSPAFSRLPCVPSKSGPFVGFILEDHAPCIDPLPFNYHAARELSGTEKEKYFPVFLKQFPAFTMEKMNEVHHCKYVWYDGTEAPYLY